MAYAGVMAFLCVPLMVWPRAPALGVSGSSVIYYITDPTGQAEGKSV